MEATEGFYTVEAISPINIALVKYWGKVDEQLIIPTNNSLSITVDKKDLCSRTRVTLTPPVEGGT
jgi:diphosphomevalonate decarboxylase